MREASNFIDDSIGKKVQHIVYSPYTYIYLGLYRFVSLNFDEEINFVAIVSNDHPQTNPPDIHGQFLPVSGWMELPIEREKRLKDLMTAIYQNWVHS